MLEIGTFELPESHPEFYRYNGIPIIQIDGKNLGTFALKRIDDYLRMGIPLYLCLRLMLLILNYLIELYSFFSYFVLFFSEFFVCDSWGTEWGLEELAKILFSQYLKFAFRSIH